MQNCAIGDCTILLLQGIAPPHPTPKCLWG